MELDETVCDRAVCPHPQCWVTLRRIEQGNPRLRPPPPANRQPPRGGLPILSVSTLPSSRTLQDGGAMEGSRGGTPNTPSTWTSTAGSSMEKIFFPGVNSFKEIIAPSRGSGSSLSCQRPQKVKILHPSFQDTRSRDVTIVWVPNPQHNPPKTEDREKPLKVWIKHLTLNDQPGGAKREKPNPERNITRKKQQPPTGGRPLNLTLVGSSPLPHAKDAQERTEDAVKCSRRPPEQGPDSPPSPLLGRMTVENRRVVLHDTREKCPVIAHTGPVYRLDQQSSALSDVEIDLDSIRNQYYLWKKYIHLAGPNRRIKPPDHRTIKTGRSYKSSASDQLGHIGLFPYDPDSALSYYKSQAFETPTGSVVCDTTRSRDSESRNSPSLDGFSQRSLTDEEASKAEIRHPPAACDDEGRRHLAAAEENAGKRTQKEIPGETPPPEARGIAPEHPDQENKAAPGADESTRPRSSAAAPESTAESADVHESPEQRASSPQPHPPPPTPMY
ncbi:uncharacterized protein C9orf43 homolog isoform 2-T2 [Anomaloglossus baeobatrachus]|uniref:uncharacterized protein C9orf43 homolog isoform X2 n=1 Tax=Anomaloglossus baeobatrachus TaxID=238106 RepID=UPI003F502B96